MARKLILQTDRLLLREFDEDDLPIFFRLGTEPAIIRYTGAPPLTSLDQAREIMRSAPLADYQKHGYGRWACVLKATGAVIGFQGLKYLPELNEVDLGYRFVPEQWGQGYATESGRAALQYGFDQLGLDAIIGLVDPENTASIHVLEKLGMTRTGPIAYRDSTPDRYVIRPEAMR
jgi:RimJ/RimL family protein N-acetyltransferase